MPYIIETKKEFRAAARGKTIREVMVTGALADTRELELRFTDGRSITLSSTTYRDLRVE